MGMPVRSAASRRGILALVRTSEATAATASVVLLGVTMISTVVIKRSQRNPTRGYLFGHTLYQICTFRILPCVHTHERSPLSDAIAAQIRAEIAASDMTQGEVADAAGMARATVNRLAQGIRPPDVNQLDRVCRALGISMADFIARAESRMKA